MKFENPQPAEWINVTPRNHLMDFFILSTGTIVGIVLISYFLGVLAGYLAQRVPFEVEVAFSQPFEKTEEAITEKQKYLKNLVSSIALCSDLPNKIQIKHHYNEDNLINAFATLGGNIVIFQGMIDELDNENQLAMIIAHEIAHIKNRHPIKSLGRGVIISISFAMLFGNNIANPLGQTGLLTALSFSREMEIQADSDGLVALQQCYGHIGGSREVFAKLEVIQQRKGIKQLPFLSTHPLNKNRISNTTKLSLQNSWDTKGKITKFPEFIQN